MKLLENNITTTLIQPNESFVRILIENFIKGGLIIGGCIAIIEMIHKSNNLINIFGFLSGSFFFINIYQFYYIAHKNPKLSEGFLYFTVLGGVGWVFMASFMYIAYFYMPLNMIILSSIGVYLVMVFGFLWGSGSL